MKKKTSMCKTNKEALRWCKTNRVVVEFSDWKKRLGEECVPEGIVCAVFYEVPARRGHKGNIVKRCIDSTLMKAVNKMIKDRSEEEKKS